MKRTIHNPAIRVTMTFLRTAAALGGDVTEVEATVEPGGGNPLHFHKHYEETFTVVEGEILFQLSGSTGITLKAGDRYAVQPREAHSFHNATDRPVRVRMCIEPGHQGFEDAMRIMFGLASDGLYNKRGAPRSIQHLAVCLSLSDTNLPGVLSILNAPLRLVAGWARRRGVQNQLRQRYCV